MKVSSTVRGGLFGKGATCYLARQLPYVEIELSILVRQCLGQRIPDMTTLQSQVTAWQDRRNDQHATIRWQFSVDKARTKLARLYPSLPAR